MVHLRDSGGGITRLVKASNLKSANIPRWDDMLPTLSGRNYEKFALFSRTAVHRRREGLASIVPLECMIDEGVPDDPHPPLLLGRGEDDDHYMTWARRGWEWHSPCHVYLDQLFATDWDAASGYQGGAHPGHRTRRGHLGEWFTANSSSNLVNDLERLKAAIDAAPGVAASDFRLVMIFDN